MKRSKRLLSALLLAALMIGLLSGVAYADRNADAVSYLKSYLQANGREVRMFDTHIFSVTLPAVADGNTFSTGPTVRYFPNADAIEAEGFAFGATTVRITLDQTGKRSEVYYANVSFQRPDAFNHADVRADTTVPADGLSDFSEQEQRTIRSELNTAFHRALLGLSEILKTGGFTLADLGFTGYTPYAGVCSRLAGCPGKQFKDMPLGGTWAHDAIDWAVDQKITTGTSDTAFSPDAVCTRAQIVTFLWRSAGSARPENDTNPFTDVSDSAYYRDAVLWALERGITTGTSDAAFSPDAVCTRAQVVTFLYRFVYGSSDIPSSEETPRSFPDVPTDAYYAIPVVWALNAAITTGTSETTFSPNSGCTRAQVVTFLYRAQTII